MQRIHFGWRIGKKNTWDELTKLQMEPADEDPEPIKYRSMQKV
jgi:hypothetical protein